MYKRLSPFCWLLAAALCLPAAAQVNYKSTMPDGRVVYGDKPAPGAAKVEQLRGAPTQGVNLTNPGDAKVLRELEESRADRTASSARLRTAEQAVRKAEAALAAGKEPQEGDRIGTVGGNQRFSDAYWERQKRLAQEYEAARANYDRIERELAKQGQAVASKPSGKQDPRPELRDK